MRSAALSQTGATDPYATRACMHAAVLLPGQASFRSRGRTRPEGPMHDGAQVRMAKDVSPTKPKCGQHVSEVGLYHDYFCALVDGGPP